MLVGCELQFNNKHFLVFPSEKLFLNVLPLTMRSIIIGKIFAQQGKVLLFLG
jgi:hypothetical protein